MPSLTPYSAAIAASTVSKSTMRLCLTSDMGFPAVSWTLHKTSTGSQLGSDVMDVPESIVGASCVWNGPRLDPSVDELGLG